MFTTYVRKDFLEGTALYGGENAYQEFVVKRQLWHFGMDPDQVAKFLADYGWSETEQMGPQEFTHRYLRPRGRGLASVGDRTFRLREKDLTETMGQAELQIGIPLAAFVYDCLAASLRRQTGHYRRDSLLWL